MNPEFSNELLPAHGSMEGDDSLLKDSGLMQKYASIAPEIVEKLRNVEIRLREAVLNLQAFSIEKAIYDRRGLAPALEMGNEDYFSESSETGQEEDVDEDTKRDTDQPDREQESLVNNEEEGASSETMGVDGQDLIGDMCYDEFRPYAYLERSRSSFYEKRDRSCHALAAIPSSSDVTEGASSRYRSSMQLGE